MRKRNIILVTLLISILTIIMVFIKIKESAEYEIDPKSHEYYTEDRIGREELVLEVVKKNNDWTGLPLSKKFRKKYNPKDGILGKINFDTVELNHFKEGEKSFIGGTVHLYIKKGKQEIVYFYAQKYTDSEELLALEYLDDVELIGPIYVTDENGEELDFRYPFNDKFKIHNLYGLARGNAYKDEESVAVTSKFHQKYPFFLDLFIHYSPLSYNDIDFLEKESDLDNNIAIFEVNSILECKKRKYEVKLIFDDKLYLDDADVKLVKEEDYRGDKQYITAKIVYQNSNWENLEITDNFRKKYNNINGLIEDISEINIDIEMDSQTIVMNKEYINTFVRRDGSKVSYKFEFIDNEKGWVDDIIISKV